MSKKICQNRTEKKNIQLHSDFQSCCHSECIDMVARMAKHNFSTLYEFHAATGKLCVTIHKSTYEFIAQFENGESTFRAFNVISYIFQCCLFRLFHVHQPIRMKSIDVISKIIQSIHTYLYIPIHKRCNIFITRTYRRPILLQSIRMELMMIISFAATYFWFFCFSVGNVESVESRLALSQKE